jgi:hypothetical protein
MDGSIKTISDLIKALEELGDKKILEKGSDLYKICEDAFKRLHISKFFKENDVLGDIIALKNLPDSVKADEIGKINYDTENLDPKSLNKQDLDTLIKDYEETKDKAVKEVYEQEIYKRTGKENVDQFIKTQKEIAARNEEKLKKIDPKLKGEIETKLEKVEQGMEEVKAKKIEEVVLEEKEYKKKELEKEVQKIVKDKEKAREISQEVIKERAEIKVQKKADEIVIKTCEELKNEQVIVTEKTREELKENILKSWENGEKLYVPDEIKTAVQDQTTIKKIEKASENFKEENLELIVEHRGNKLEKEITYQLRDNGVKDEKLIKEYAETVRDLNYSSERIVKEENREEIYRFVDDYLNPEVDGKKVINRTPGQIEASIDEAQFMARNVIKSPREFNRRIRRYNELRELIGADKLPKVKEIRITEKMANLFKEGSEAQKWMNGAQRMVGFLDKINNFPANLMARFGFQDTGLKLLGKVGGEASVAFVKNAAAIIAKEGTLNGIKSILMGLAGKGAVIAGEGAAGGAALMGGLAAIPGAGWIAAAAIAVAGILKKIGGKIGDWMKDKLNINLNGAGDFLSNTLGLANAGKWVVGAIGSMGTFFAGLPAMMGSIGPLIAIVLICVIVFMFASNMSNQQMASTLVPPADMENCVLESKYNGNGSINCNPNAPVNTVTGVDKANFVRVAGGWKAGVNYSDTCFNDTVNRALCAGINPIYALAAWLHESGASNYTGRSDIEDFGMHSIPQNEDFNTQINAFLKLDPATGCINDPRIGGDYWLAFSANYLNGSNCDPDHPNSITKMTPRQYEVEWKQTWGMVVNSLNPSLPNGIHVPVAGKNCDTANQAYVPNNENTKRVKYNGDWWICTTNTSAAVGNIDPNAPGIDGNPVDGECSVGDVVVPTKQCDPRWGNINLVGSLCSSGKPATICSKGCGPTSVSMLFRHVNGSLTPNNVIFGSGSAYNNIGCEGSYIGEAVTELTKKFGNGVNFDSVTLGCDKNAIAKWICDGKVVMVLANFYRNSALELAGHYVLAIGVKNGQIVVADPYFTATDTPFDGVAAYGHVYNIKGCITIDKSAVK